MKINHLHLKNFRNHQETTLHLDRLNFFIGHNNAGKSSLLAALEWGLTGRCLWTDKAGRGATDLIRQGEKQAAVALEVEGLGTILRSLPPHFLQVGHTSGVNEGQGKIQSHLGVDEHRLQVALNATAFLTMSQAEQRTFLFSAYGLSWTVEGVAEKLQAYLVKEHFTTEEARRIAAKAKRYFPQGILGGPEIFETMEKRARDERKDCKREKQQVEGALAEFEGSGHPQYLHLDWEEAKSQLTELKARRDEVLLACGAHREAQLRRQTLFKQRSTTEETLAKAQEKAQSLTLQLENLNELVTPAVNNFDPETTSTPIESSLRKTLEQAQSAAAAAQSLLTSLTQAGLALAQEARCCPLAPDLISCNLTPNQVNEILSKLQKEHRKTSEELANHKAIIQDTSEKLENLRTSLEKSRAHAKQVLFLQSEVNAQQALIKNLEASLEILKREAKSLPQKDFSLQEDLAELECTIAQQEKTLAQFHESQILASRRATLQQDLETLTYNLADLDVLVKALGPDGLRKDLLGGVLKDFVERVNHKLGRLTDGTYHFTLSSEMVLLCCVNGGPTLPLMLLSKSEQLRVGIALSAVLSQAVGIRFLAIDEADMLDQDNRDLLAEMLLDSAEEFDQILVFTTVGNVQPHNPGLPGVKMFWVEDGNLRELKGVIDDGSAEGTPGTPFEPPGTNCSGLDSSRA